LTGKHEGDEGHEEGRTGVARTMNASWFNERAVSLVASVAAIIKEQGSSWDLDQILFDALRIYSCTFLASPNTTVESALLNMDRPIGTEDLIQVRKAMALIKAHPDEVATILEKFATL
jgi:hypothetical protein